MSFERDDIFGIPSRPGGSEEPLSEDNPRYVFEKAVRMKNTGRDFDSQAKPLVNMVLQFLIHTENASVAKLKRMESHYPHLYRAIRLDRDHTDNRSLFIECGVLGGAKQSIIAEYAGLPLKTIDYYEQIFFNVRDKIDKPGFITGKVLSTSIDLDKRSSVHDVWRLVAYRAGWDEFINYVSGPGDRFTLFQSSEMNKFLVASMGEPVNVDDEVELSEILKRGYRIFGGSKGSEAMLPTHGGGDDFEYRKLQQKLEGLVDLRPQDVIVDRDGDQESIEPGLLPAPNEPEEGIEDVKEAE